jgi:hypothetical protein
LKSLFVKEPLLRHIDFGKPCVVHVDSLGFAIAAVLSQPDNKGNLWPVSYFSRKLTERERSWMIFNLELLAIVKAFEEWRAWLMGTETPVKVYSDHSNLLYFKTAKCLLPKQARWALFLDNFNLLIYHIAGSKNPADAPSRQEDFIADQIALPESTSIVKKLVTEGEQCEAIASDLAPQVHDLQFQMPNQDLLKYFAVNYLDQERKETNLQLLDGVFWYQGRIVFPSSLRVRLMKMYHDAPTVGHPGIARKLSVLTRTFTWIGVRKSVMDFVSLCDSCQRVKARRQAKDGQLVSALEIPQSIQRTAYPSLFCKYY